VLAIAVVVPETALLVPGAAGRAIVLDDVRAAALDAVREVVRAAPDRVVVVAPGPVDRVLDPPGRPSLAAAGVADAALGWQPAGPQSDGPGPGVGASVALLLLAHSGWQGPVTVVEVAPGGRDGTRVGGLRALGVELAAEPGRLALLVAGSLSARHGPAAPLADDERAAPLDAAICDDLAAGDPPALWRLGAIPGSLAADLAVTAWAPLQVLLGAAAGAGPLESAVRRRAAPFGVPYLVALWRALR
jgi:hypothetical protein